MSKEKENIGLLHREMDSLLDDYTKRRIADLEAKLAESEEKLKSSWYEICPKCGNPYGASQFIRENGEVICSNCMKIEDIYEPLVNQLEQQLAEKEQQIKTQKSNIEFLYDLFVSPQGERTLTAIHQDKISFAVEQLEKVKASIEVRLVIIQENYTDDLYTKKEYLDMTVENENILKKIDNQIKRLKEGK